MDPRDCPPTPPVPEMRDRPAPESPGAITGRVTLVPGGEPVAGAQVVVPVLRRGAITDSAGVFRIDSLPPGTYDLIVRRLGTHQRDLAGVTVSRAAGRDLTVALKMVVYDECPGFAVVVVRKPSWKWW